MVEVQVLPPRKEPKRPTVVRRAETLKEHLEAFMSKNNARGFVIEEPVVEIKPIPMKELFARKDEWTFSEFFLLFAQHQYVTEADFKRFAGTVQKRFTEPGVRDLKLCWVYELVSRFFGYKSHSSLKQYARLGIDDVFPGMIRNFRFGDNLGKALFDISERVNNKKMLGQDEVRKQHEIRSAFKEGNERLKKKPVVKKPEGNKVLPGDRVHKYKPDMVVKVVVKKSRKIN